MYHALVPEKTLESLETNLRGLTEKEVHSRRRRFGSNILPAKTPSKLWLFFDQFKNPLIYILVGAGLITYFLKDYTDSIVIWLAVVLNTFIGFFQEYKADQALRALKKVLKTKALVIRDGKEKEVLEEELTPGDIFLLKPGDKIPADGRLIEVNNLKINESALTGEWLAEDKIISPLPPDTPLADRRNMVYQGAWVEDGFGRAAVTATGIKTEIGRLAETLKKIEEEKTPLQRKLVKFSELIAGLVLLISFILFIQGLLAGRNFLEIFTTAAAVAVAAVPEGLPAALSLILAFGLQRILKKKGLVRKLTAAEALGSTSIILTDKTGTLTEAKMEVAGVFTTTTELFKNGSEYSKSLDKDGKESHILALKIAALCSEAFVENLDEPMEKWLVRGRPTDRALLLASIQAGLNKKELIEEQPRLDFSPFNPTFKYSASLHRLDNESILYIMGAPEAIFGKSSLLHIDDHEEALTETNKKKLEQKLTELAAKGQRVVGVAYKRIKNKELRIKNDWLQELVFVGFISLHDPIRHEAKEAIRTCREAGIRPIIITGDHRLTAQAVAHEVGLIFEEKNVIEGVTLEKLSEEDFKKQFKDFEIYARVTPEQKLKIVEAWQGAGEIVAVTGDGVNDALALKKSDIGVALGSGTEIAKEVSDLVLLNDSFGIIVTAIEEGRHIINNIRKVITYLLADSFTEIILVSSSLIFGWPLPILAAQILWVNLIEDTLPSLALTLEPKEKHLMRRKPQKTHEIPLLTNQMKVLIFLIGIVTDLLLLGLFFWLLKWSGYEISHIRSIVFAGLAMDSLFFIFSCRSLKRNLWQISFFSNPYLLLSWIFGVIMLLVGLYFPPLQKLLKTQPLNFFDWQIILGLGVINLFLIELTKWVFIKKENNEKP